jgi:hypothetical protein
MVGINVRREWGGSERVCDEMYICLIMAAWHGYIAMLACLLYSEYRSLGPWS